MAKTTKDYRKLKAEILVLCRVSHDSAAKEMKALGEHISGAAINRIMTANGWAVLRDNTDARARRLAEIRTISPKLAELVDKRAKVAQAEAIAKLRGRLTETQRRQMRYDSTLVRDIGAAKAFVPAEPEAARETMDRVVEVYDPEEKRKKPAVVTHILSDCTLSWLASRGLIPEQLAVSGIKYRSDFHRIGGGLQSTHPKLVRAQGSPARGLASGALDAMQQRKKVFAALRYLYPSEAELLERLLHLVCVEDRSFKEILEMGEVAGANRKGLIMALEPVGWAYGDWLEGVAAARLNSWWKGVERLDDIEP